MTVWLTYDVRSAARPGDSRASEHELEFDTPDTIDHLSAALAAAGTKVVRIGGLPALVDALADRADRPGLVFNMAEGSRSRSREAHIPALLEAFGLTYTFSDPVTASVCHYKPWTKVILQRAALPTPDWVCITTVSGLREEQVRAFGYPVLAKPPAEGTSIGIDDSSVLRSWPDLCAHVELLVDRYGEALVEPFLSGPEFTVALLGTGAKTEVVGCTEVRMLDGSAVYGWLQKEECETRVDYVPMMQRDLELRIADLACRAYRLLGCRDAGRVDVRLDHGGNPYLLEINPIPGLHPTHSDLPIIAAQRGMSYESVIAAVVRSARSRGE